MATKRFFCKFNHVADDAIAITLNLFLPCLLYLSCSLFRMCREHLDTPVSYSYCSTTKVDQNAKPGLKDKIYKWKPGENILV